MKTKLNPRAWLRKLRATLNYLAGRREQRPGKGLEIIKKLGAKHVQREGVTLVVREPVERGSGADDA